MSHRVLLSLTVFNVALLLFVLVFLLPQMRTVEAQSASAVAQNGVLRGRALEIVDAQGKVRASIQVLPPDATGNSETGKPYPETVLLRLIDRNGQPSVKLGTSEQGAGLSLVGGDDVSYVVLHADLQAGSLKMTNKQGRQQLIQP